MIGGKHELKIASVSQLYEHSQTQFQLIWFSKHSGNVLCTWLPVKNDSTMMDYEMCELECLKVKMTWHLNLNGFLYTKHKMAFKIDKTRVEDTTF